MTERAGIGIACHTIRKIDADSDVMRMHDISSQARTFFQEMMYIHECKKFVTDQYLILDLFNKLQTIG